LEDLDAEVEINRAWETIRENIKISAKESLGYFDLKKHKPWFDEGCSTLLDQRKQTKFQCLQDLSEINEDNLKDKINELATNNKNKKIRDLFRGINEFERG
jgi:hypothetical protein